MRRAKTFDVVLKEDILQMILNSKETRMASITRHAWEMLSRVQTQLSEPTTHINGLAWRIDAPDVFRARKT